QTGKSTLVGRISSAKPKVSSFPFTTKDVILGHTVVEGIKLQIVDTPGILDRPISELNVIEQKAYVAIKYLADLILFLIDPLETYYSLQSQLNLLSNIVKEFGINKVLVLINKIDAASPEKIVHVRELIRKEFNEIASYCISALHGIGLQEVINDVLRHLGLMDRSCKFHEV
ncbi:MAG: GTPase, partial [Sulfolobales archaeon]